ncbi:helix-turn-helix transcriptional regulator [Streptomyces sp. TRM49041]|uniref:helix-turn-helix domain-containing protein n=1 Tax=Streptomyces sp. TRM49041 TaxID=2603216 RepID=UPI0021CCAD0A|nr:helix-turn-helix transcriptional regulator [Streptomyces sp. TRM49041]
MPRQISYRWRLRELMAARGMFTVGELMPHLAERGITLSSSQVHRLVSGTPERLSLPVLAALCDILGCTPPTRSPPRPRTSRPAEPPAKKLRST